VISVRYGRRFSFSSGLRTPCRGLLGLALWIGLLLPSCVASPLPTPFEIRVLDQSTGRGIPAVELRTLDERRFLSDSSGTIAFFEPDLLGQDVYFVVRAYGYRLSDPEADAAAGPAANRAPPGTILSVQPGGSAQLFLYRENIAQRLYRLTGSGRYRARALLGDGSAEAPWPSPEPEGSAPAQVPGPILGLDSAFATLYRGQLFWIFGDLRSATSPIANLRVTGARSELPESGGRDPRFGIDLDYIGRPGFVQSLVETDAPVVWLSAPRIVVGDDGTERLYATYAKIGEGLRAHEYGLAAFDAARNVFELVEAYPETSPIVPLGHVFAHADSSGAHLHYDLAIRSPRNAGADVRLDRFEAFTPLAPGQRFESAESVQLEQDRAGHLIWDWKAGTAPVTGEQWRALVSAGRVSANEAWMRWIDVESGEEITLQNGSVHWNPYRQRWILVRTQLDGRSRLGEVFYAEADTPLGPWAYVQRIVTHALPPPPFVAPGLTDETQGLPRLETQSFYNPVHHPELDQAGGREIFFQGTLSSLFTDVRRPLAGYDYNQIVYSLDLEDPRLYLPVAIYRSRTAGTAAGDVAGWSYGPALRRDSDAPGVSPTLEKERELAFFAPDRPRPGTVPVHEIRAPGQPPRLRALGPGLAPESTVARFHCALDPETPATLALYEVRDAAGAWTYSAAPMDAAPAGAAVLCYVWPAPVSFPASVTARQPRAFEPSPK